SFDYSPTGQITTTVFGSGASTTRTYDANALYRLSHLVTQSGTSTVQDKSYIYDAVGNIKRITNATSSTTSNETIEYGYEALNRLILASSTAITQQVSTSSSAVVKFLLLAGGGGGAGSSVTNLGGAGGGAGGLIINNSYPLSSGTYSVVIGAGGSGGGTHA